MTSGTDFVAPWPIATSLSIADVSKPQAATRSEHVPSLRHAEVRNVPRELIDM